MSGLEIPGLVLSICMGFKGAVDTALWIETFFDEEKSSCGYLALRYHIEKTRLQLWGEICRANNDNSPSECTLRDKPVSIQETIIRILGEIQRQYQRADALVVKYNINIPERPPLPIEDNLRVGSALARALSRFRTTPRARFCWTLKGKLEFSEVVSKIQELTKSLWDISLNPGQPQLLTNVLPSHVLVPVNDPELLRTLDGPRSSVDPDLAASARAKSLHQIEPHQSSPSVITTNRLQFFTNSSTCGILTQEDKNTLSVWIEWNTFDAGPGSSKYAERITSLGYLLEGASDPALRLPHFYGIYEDLAYELNHGTKRIGFVFSVPREQSPNPFDGNLRDRPPTMLSTLIRVGTSIPSLGDRFQLAYTLAIAFSRFHAAGWLHKGLHSGSIVFLRRTNDSGISVLEPFVTGFQYSRPQNAASLPQGPLEDAALQHYYHPDVLQRRGFSKKRDLYGLGVVLCEVGRWSLVASERTHRAFLAGDRAAWQTYMVDKVAEDLGWRMGRKYQGVVKTLLQCSLPDDGDTTDDALFAQQYLEKVVQPLSTCSA